jgi:hypothetical protein
MALYFNAMVDCGRDEGSCLHIARIFDGLQISFGSDVTTHCSSRAYQAEGGTWRVNIQPMGASNGSCIPGDVPRDELLCNSGRYGIAIAIYDKLRTQTGYRYALVGFETQDYETFEDFPPGWSGLVMREDLIGHHSKSPRLEPFSHGYLWTPIFSEWLWAREPSND